MSLLKFEKVDGFYSVHYENGVYLGDIYAEIDGFYVFFPSKNGGFWEARVLEAITNKLDELNAPVEREMQNYFDKESKISVRQKEKTDNILDTPIGQLNMAWCGIVNGPNSFNRLFGVKKEEVK